MRFEMFPKIASPEARPTRRFFELCLDALHSSYRWKSPPSSPLSHPKAGTSASSPPPKSSRASSPSQRWATTRSPPRRPPKKLRVVVRARPLQPSEVAADLTLADDAVAVRTVKSTAQGKDSVEEASFFSTASTAAPLPSRMSLTARCCRRCRRYSPAATRSPLRTASRTRARRTRSRARVAPMRWAASRVRSRRPSARSATTLRSAPPPLTARSPRPSRSRARRRRLELDDKCTYEVKASFLEVYGNDAFDLLATPEPPKRPGLDPPKRAVLRLKEDRGHVFVEGLKEVELPDLESAVRAVSSAGRSARRRRTASTSSRRARMPSSASSCSRTARAPRSPSSLACASSTSPAPSGRRRRRPTARGSTRRCRSTRT